MILGFRHRGLERLFEKGDRRRIAPTLVTKVERVLARLDAAGKPEDMNLPGFGLHPLKGERAGLLGGDGIRQLACGLPLRRAGR